MPRVQRKILVRNRQPNMVFSSVDFPDDSSYADHTHAEDLRSGHHFLKQLHHGTEPFAIDLTNLAVDKLDIEAIQQVSGSKIWQAR